MNTMSPCGHATSQVCSGCGICKQCFVLRTDETTSARGRIDLLTKSLGESAVREEQLRHFVELGKHNPIERTERDLAVARVVLLRRRLETALRSSESQDWQSVIQEALNADSLTRTHDPQSIIALAAVENKVPLVRQGTTKEGA